MKNDTLIIVMFWLAITWFALQRLHVRLRAIEAKLNKLLALQGIDPNELQEPSAEVLALVHAGKRIAAIKAYRLQTARSSKRPKK